MARKKLLLCTNPPWIKSGLAESGRYLAQYLTRTGKYDLTYYCSQVAVEDPQHGRQPWKSMGCIPNDPALRQQLQQDQGRMRHVAYGNLLINQTVAEVKPDIIWCSDDIWAYQPEFFKAAWWKQINSVLHVTVDSLPVGEMAFEQAKSTPHFFTWAKFAADEMRKRGKEYGHIRQIYGATDVHNFAPLSVAERADLRKRFGIDHRATVFGYTFRNQLRKEALTLLSGYKRFKDANPKVPVKVHLHTSWSEIAAGWDFPRLIRYLKIDPNDILCTYVCKHCGGWHVRPYGGEDIDCPLCKAQKSCVTTTLIHGVPDEEMKLLYGIRDATISPLTSGGQEYEHTNTLLCGLPLACTSYSAGADFTDQPFVYPIKWHPRFEAQTSFMKATNDVASIAAYIEQVVKMTAAERQAVGEQGRDWAAKTFSIETIGAQWDAVFDSMQPKDWSSISLEAPRKNDKYPIPTDESNEAFIKKLYNHILLVEPDPDGMKNWLASLAGGVTRDHIYNYFIGRAQAENGTQPKQVDFGDLFDGKVDDPKRRKRILFVMKESGGDVFVATGDFPGLKVMYPDADLYVATDPKFHDILAGNPHVHKILTYHPAMDQEMVMRHYVDYYYWPAVATQRQLNYLTHDKIGLNLATT